MITRGEVRPGKVAGPWPCGVRRRVWGSKLVQPGTTWYNLKTEVVPTQSAEVPGFRNARYGWYDLLQSLAHPREKTGFSGILRKYEGSSEKVVPSVPEPWKSLGWRIFRWYNLHSEVVPGRTEGGLV